MPGAATHGGGIKAVGQSTPANLVECASLFATLQLRQASDFEGALSEPFVRDHVRAKLLHVLLVAIGGKDLKGFGVLTHCGHIHRLPAAVC